MKLTDPDVEVVLTGLLEAGLPDEMSTILRAAANAVGGLPVSADMGGVVVIKPNGSIVLYDPASGSSTLVADERWRRAAIIRAAQKYFQLSALVPRRQPSDARCDACGGTGKILAAICGTCLGLGWIWLGPIEGAVAE